MKTRVITALWALVIFIPVMIFHDTWAFPAFFALCAVLSVFEMTRAIGVHKNGWIVTPLYLFAALAPFTVRVYHLFSPSAQPDSFFARYNPGTLFLVAALLVMLWLFAVAVFSKGKEDVAIAGTTFFTVLYAIAGYTCMVWVHDFAKGYGKYFFLMIFVGAWITDTFAYFSGRLFGKHKLIPEISPKKTVEGSIGGILFCVAAFVGYCLLYNNLWIPEGGAQLNLVVFIVIGLVTSVVSQIGDLSMSAVKRHYGIKDYSQILPGHGGVLDRFDSVLAVAILLTVAYIILNGAI